MNNVFLQEDTPVKTMGDYKIRCYDPYGFWRFEGDEEGDTIDVPMTLKGWFTTLKQATDTYNANMKTEADTKAVKETVRKKPKNLLKTVTENDNIFA